MKEINEMNLKLLQAMMSHPEASDREISRIVGTSQPTVTRRRIILKKHMVMRHEIIPNLAALGYEVIAIGTTDLSERHKPLLENDARVIFACMNINECIVVSVHKNYDAYAEFSRELHLKHATLICTADRPLKAMSFKQLALHKT